MPVLIDHAARGNAVEGPYGHTRWHIHVLFIDLIYFVYHKLFEFLAFLVFCSHRRGVRRGGSEGVCCIDLTFVGLKSYSQSYCFFFSFFLFFTVFAHGVNLNVV